MTEERKNEPIEMNALRRHAKEMNKDLKIGLMKCQNKLAQTMGYKNWNELLKSELQDNEVKRNLK